MRFIITAQASADKKASEQQPEFDVELFKAYMRFNEEMHQAGRKVWVWTVNRRPTMMRLAKWEVDGIISDRTDTLARTLHV